VLLARGVDDEKQPLLDARQSRDQEIVENAAGLIEKLSIARALRRERNQIRRRKGFERACDACSCKDRLAHMGHIEEACGAPRMQRFGDDALLILQWHLVAGERRHARAEPPMQRIKRKLRQRWRCGGRDVEFGHHQLRQDMARAAKRTLPRAPSVR
jgi:hypothetical protein